MSITFSAFSNGTAMVAADVTTEMDKLWAYLQGGTVLTDHQDGELDHVHFPTPKHLGAFPNRYSIGLGHKTWERGIIEDRVNDLEKAYRADLFKELVEEGGYLVVPYMSLTIREPTDYYCKVLARWSAWERHSLHNGGVSGLVSGYMGPSHITPIGSGHAGRFRLGVRRRDTGAVTWLTPNRQLHTTNGIGTSAQYFMQRLLSERHTHAAFTIDASGFGQDGVDVFLAWYRDTGLHEDIQQIVIGNRRMVVEVSRHQ